jgi:hypothetical protein
LGKWFMRWQITNIADADARISRVAGEAKRTEEARQEAWNFKYDFGKKADDAEWESEKTRRKTFADAYPQIVLQESKYVTVPLGTWACGQEHYSTIIQTASVLSIKSSCIPNSIISKLFTFNRSRLNCSTTI